MASCTRLPSLDGCLTNVSDEIKMNNSDQHRAQDNIRDKRVFDVEFKIVMQCVERITKQGQIYSRLGMDTNTRLNGTPTFPMFGKIRKKSVHNDDDVISQLIVELSIIRRSLLRMQTYHTEYVKGMMPLHEKVHELENQVNLLQSENYHMQQLLLNGKRKSIQPKSFDYPVSRRQTEQLPSQMEKLQQDFIPEEDEGSVFRSQNPLSFWATLVRHLQFGKGEYKFLVDTTNTTYFRRVPITRESAFFEMESLADTLFQHNNPCVNIRNLFRNSLQLRPKVRSREIPDRCQGIVSFIGTDDFRLPFTNPSQGSISILVACSSLWGQSDPASLVDERVEYFCTKDSKNQWVSFDFSDMVIIPSAYSFVSFHPILSGYYPRNWLLEGSLNGKTWTILKEHYNDETINKSTPCGTWSIRENTKSKNHLKQDLVFGLECIDPFEEETRQFYRYFRIRQVGPNSFGSLELQLTSIEIFGEILYVDGQEKLVCLAI